jgi:hypothetical protein
MSKYRGNALRKEDIDMATPVQEVASMTATATAPARRRAEAEGLQSVSETAVHHFQRHRAITPMVLLALLGLVFAVSPLLPVGIREYITALTR